MDKELKIESVEDVKNFSYYLIQVILIGFLLVVGLFLICVSIENFLDNASVILSIIMFFAGIGIFLCMIKLIHNISKDKKIKK